MQVLDDKPFVKICWMDNKGSFSAFKCQPITIISSEPTLHVSVCKVDKLNII